MKAWKSRRKQAAYSRLVARVSEHDVIRAAEETVGAAWMAGLRQAEGQAATARRVCTHMRDTAYEVYNSAKSGQDSELLSESYRELAEALPRLRIIVFSGLALSEEVAREAKRRGAAAFVTKGADFRVLLERGI